MKHLLKIALVGALLSMGPGAGGEEPGEEPYAVLVEEGDGGGESAARRRTSAAGLILNCSSGRWSQEAQEGA